MSQTKRPLTEAQIEKKFRLKAQSRGWSSLKFQGINCNGQPDRLFYKGLQYFFVEFKSPKGRLTALQNLFKMEAEEMGAPYFVVRDPSELEAILEIKEKELAASALGDKLFQNMESPNDSENSRLLTYVMYRMVEEQEPIYIDGGNSPSDLEDDANLKAIEALVESLELDDNGENSPSDPETPENTSDDSLKSYGENSPETSKTQPSRQHILLRKYGEFATKDKEENKTLSSVG